jgi:subtilase family serine protease
VACCAGVPLVGAPAVAAHPRIDKAACNATPAPGHAQCFAETVNPADVASVTADATAGTAAALVPANVQVAYKLPTSTGGANQTVAIVIPYDDPNLVSDLTYYRSYFGMPACSTSAPRHSVACLRRVNESGGGSLPAASAGWAQELTLDVDAVSTACPACHILVVEATTSSFGDLGVAEDTAVRLGANAITNSYGSAEFATEASFAGHYNHPHVAITVSAGDAGYGTEFPAAAPTVTAVGGTTLIADSTTTRGWTESAWSHGGSGCSAYLAKPTAQLDAGCSGRSVADVSADADPASGLYIYDTDGEPGWLIAGGTSLAAPLVAGAYALAGNAYSVEANPSAGAYAYAHTGALNDVTAGSNGTCAQSYLCAAALGYDGPTGLGSPSGVGAF